MSKISTKDSVLAILYYLILIGFVVVALNKIIIGNPL